MFFQQISPLSFLANLVAIPAVTLWVTPLALLGVLWAPLWSVGAAAAGALGAAAAALTSAIRVLGDSLRTAPQSLLPQGDGVCAAGAVGWLRLAGVGDPERLAGVDLALAEPWVETDGRAAETDAG